MQKNCLLWTTTFVQFLALSLWIGGMVAVAILVAPAVFKVLDDKMVAGEVVEGALRRFNWMSYGCGLLMLVAVFFRTRLLQEQPVDFRFKLWTASQLLLIVLMLAIACYLGFSLLPKMDAVAGVATGGKLEGAVKRGFDSLHSVYKGLSHLNLLLALILLGLMVSKNRS